MELPPMTAPLDSPVLRASSVAKYLDIGRSTVWALARECPDFPKPRKLSNRTTVWLRAELDAWLSAKFDNEAKASDYA